MNYRIAELKDTEELDNLLSLLIKDEKENYDNTIESTEVKDYYKNMIIRENNIIYLCKKENKIIGYVFVKTPENVAIINALYVLPEERGKGIASNLLKLAINWIKEKNIKTVEISVLSKNTKAKELYKKCGFNEIFKETYRQNL